MAETKEYTNGELTVVWDAKKCMHAGKCVAGLPDVFKPKERPWIQAEGASTNALKETINQCPSGALSYVSAGEHSNEQASVAQTSANPSAAQTVVEVVPNGPLIVKGKVLVRTAEGVDEMHEKRTALCRCGSSSRKPYCDGSHKESGFKD